MNFNCAACNYECETEWQDGQKVTVKGDEAAKIGDIEKCNKCSSLQSRTIFRQ